MIVMMITIASVLLAACSPAADCITTDGGTQICVSVNTVDKTATPGATPEPTSPPESGVITCTDGMEMLQIQPGQTVTVKSGCRVSGDIVVNGETLYDDNGDSGLLVDFQQEARVFAQWGASVNADSVDTWVQNMKNSGCTGTCSTVSVITWPR